MKMEDEEEGACEAGEWRPGQKKEKPCPQVGHKTATHPFREPEKRVFTTSSRLQEAGARAW